MGFAAIKVDSNSRIFWQYPGKPVGLNLDESVGLAERILNKKQVISAVSRLCKTARFRQSECRKCEEICPEKAISLSIGPKISSDCSNCGLCLNVCPTEAFYINLNLEQLLADSIASPHIAPKANASIAFHCLESQPLNSASIGLRCLGNLTEISLLRAAVSGLKELQFSRGQCSECHLSMGGKLFDTMVGTIVPLCEAIGRDEFLIRIVQQKRKHDIDEVALSRRKLFTGLMRHVLDPSPEMGQEGNLGGVSNLHNRKGLSSKKTALNELLARNAVVTSDNGAYTTIVPWKKMVVDQTKCIACGICASVCPTGALTKIQKQDQIITTINPSLCSNCFLCQEACPQHAIDFVIADNLKEIFSEQPVEVARINLVNCVICGEQLTPNHDSQVCTTCQKRQMSWPF